MMRTLRAFAWMRWRVLLNSLERTGARDGLERFSLAVDQLGPIIATLLLVPSALALAGLSAYAGYWLAAGTPALTFQTLRILLLLGSVFAVLAPLLMPSMEPTAMVRLLLLPVRQATLYAAQAVGALSEPWVLLSIPVVIALPIGLAVGGAGSAAIVAFLGGLLFIVCLVGLSTLSALLLHLVVRDRRRGELLALLFIVLVPALSVLPMLLMESRTRSAGEHPVDRPGRSRGMAPWVSRGAAIANVVAPSELFARTAQATAEHKLADTAMPLALLVVIGGALHGFGLLTFGSLLKSPPASGGTRRASTVGQGRAIRHLPGLPRATGAVALAQVRLALRTPRGRSILLSPLIVFSLVAIVMHRQGDMDLAGLSLADGFNLAMFGSAVSILAIQPFAMNQFAIDRAGLTMVMLAPVRTIDLLVGKAVGLALIAMGPALACCAIGAIFVGGGTLSFWLCLPLALAASYFLLAPASAMLSAIFPRTVDLNSIGHGSNPHSVAGFLGLLLFAASMVPAFLIVATATRFFGRSELAPIGMLVWCGVTLVASRILFSGAAAIFDKRRENLGLATRR